MTTLTFKGAEMIPKYRVKNEFMIDTEHIGVMFNINSKWDYLGYANGYIKLHKRGVFVDVPKDTFERHFVELKSQDSRE